MSVFWKKKCNDIKVYQITGYTDRFSAEGTPGQCAWPMLVKFNIALIFLEYRHKEKYFISRSHPSGSACTLPRAQRPFIVQVSRVQLSDLQQHLWFLAHACNPGYSGGRDQEDCGSKPALGKEFMRPPLSKKTNTKRASGVAQGVGPKFKP
jgi:hypothetical protein